VAEEKQGQAGWAGHRGSGTIFAPQKMIYRKNDVAQNAI
jgi:hypothetical protein